MLASVLRRRRAISALAIFELVRLTIPNVRPDEVHDTIMQSLPYMGGQRQ